MPTSRRRLTLPRAVLLLLAVGCAGGDPTPDAPQLAPAARWSTSDDWEPHVAADPRGEWVYQATTRIGPDRARIVVRVSADGGGTWGADQVLSDELDAYDPQLAVASDTGCVFFAWLGGPSGWMTFVRSSCDHGATWSDAVAIAPAGWTTDHGWLLVSADGGDVYVAFNGGTPEDSEEAGRGFVASSHDGGKTFTRVHVAGDGVSDYWFQTGGAVAVDGTVLVANAVSSPDYTGPTQLVLWRSTDRGASFESTTVATSQEPPDCQWAAGCTFGFFAAQSAVAVDETGALLFAWSASDTPGAPLALWTATSPGGAAWADFSAPVPLSAAGGLAGFPAAVAGPSAGDFRVAWQASEPGGDPATWNTWLQQSPDGGRTWLAAPARLSDQGAGAPYKRPAGYAFPYGDYFGLAVDGAGRTHAAWGEGASYDGPGGTWSARTL